jgi:rare lipoprotein A (peptidoglycan hydrolase)
MKNNFIKFTALMGLIFFLLLNPVVAEELAISETELLNKNFSIRLDKATIARGYTVSAFDDDIKLSLVPGILSEDTPVEVIELNESMPEPWNLNLFSSIYQFEFLNKVAYDNHKPFYIQISYKEENDRHKQAFYYDKNYEAWKPLPTKDYPEDKFVRTLIHLPFARIAVFSYPKVMGAGRASWYAYKPGNFAASPDFPKGSRLRVTNMDNDKFVDVLINDYGPDRYLHPDRVIDLEKNAFARLASLGAGMLDVKIEPLYIVPDVNGRVLGIAEKGALEEPIINLKSGIIMNEKTGEILWEKNSSSTLVLASLTKMIAIKIFLDGKPSLNQVVSYLKQDEEYNYEYCKPWESARLRVEDGDTMTIEDLIYASLVGSANNAVETLVRVSGLERSEFIKLMNDSVKKWGASTSHFVEPTGLSPDNLSSARDYAIITKEVLKHPIIEKASTMEKYEFTTINTEEFHRLKNTNKIISTDKFHINGSKTGYLDEAGYCLMTRVNVGNGLNLITVTLGADSRDQSFNETSELMEYGLSLIRK